MKKFLTLLICGSVFGLASGEASAAFVLDFEGLGNLESVGSFYNGGLGGSGSGPGTNYGVEFNADALALIDADAGGTGNIGGEPSPDTVLFFLTGSAVMNVAAGFDTGFSFYYSAINFAGVVDVYDGLNGTGSLLATVNLPLTPFNGAPDPSGQYSPLVATGVAFNGTAKSVVFGGVANQIVYDNITFGSATPVVPEPSSMVLFGIGLFGASFYRKRKQNQVIEA